HLENIHRKTNTKNAQTLSIWYLKEYHALDLRKIITIVTFLAILTPSMLQTQHNTLLIRTRTSTRTQSTSRSGNKKNEFE
ncbi:MAG: hypothetical protein PF444_00480, partial [Bacteroidales bacterium]|nr:hypothetical protein [Bacteroidales bacterium]